MRRVAEAVSAHDVLEKTRSLLATTQRGLQDLQGSDPAVRPMGIYNVAVFGRSTTLVLQNLRTVDKDGFDAWYAPFKAEMTEDPLMKYFTKLRNEILKEGPPSLSMSMTIHHLDTSDLQPLMENPPPGATSFFIGESRTGGSGWEVMLPDGTTAKYYVQLPESVRMDMSLHLPDPPSEHAGQPLPYTSVDAISQLYVSYLANLVSEAERQFGS